MTEHAKAEWYNNEHNLPDGSYIDKKGSVGYIKNGKLHRDDGPAVELFDGGKEWYKNGRLHKDDGPSVEWADGTKLWHTNGKLHRGDGPAIEYSDGREEWWYKNGKKHREDGPAIKSTAGIRRKSRSSLPIFQIWYLDDEEYETEEFYLEALKIWKMNEAMK